MPHFPRSQARGSSINRGNGKASSLPKLDDQPNGWEQVAKDLEGMSWDRVLPRVEILEKVARYEAHLARGLYKEMHELEALQTRRLGGSAPLAPLDVDGLKES